MLSRLSELDYFGSVAKKVPLFNMHAILLQNLGSESKELVQQTCKSTGYVLRHVCKELHSQFYVETVYLKNEKLFSGIIVKYINTLVRLSCDSGNLSTIHQRLLLYLHEQVQVRSNADAIPIKQIVDLLKKLDEMTFSDLCSLLKCSDSASEVEDELKTFLAKRTNVALEDQIKRCVEYWANKLKCEGKSSY